MIGIPDNDMLLFWHGVNIRNIWCDAARLDIKEYYQLEKPLFLDAGLLLKRNMESNNSLITQIECREGLNLHELKDNPCCAFLSVAKKHTDEVENRRGYSFRISSTSNTEDLSFIMRLMAKEFRISSQQIKKLLDTTGIIKNKRNYQTHPISGIGFCVKNVNNSYFQVYITNNRNTTEGKINRLSFSDVCDNTRLLLNGFDFYYEEGEVLDLTKCMYSMGMFTTFYGLDISASGITKVKIYFRTTYILGFDALCNELKAFFAQYGKHTYMPCWNDVRRAINSSKQNYIDCVAIAFKEIQGVLAVDGVQFYLAP